MKWLYAVLKTIHGRNDLSGLNSHVVSLHVRAFYCECNGSRGRKKEKYLADMIIFNFLYV